MTSFFSLFSCSAAAEDFRVLVVGTETQNNRPSRTNPSGELVGQNTKRRRVADSKYAISKKK